jgi:hypothetical protein
MNLLVSFAILVTLAQGGRGQAAQGGRGQAPPPRTAAPIDLTGNWVSIVSEDWRLRMVVAQKGDWDVIPLNEAGKKAAEAADLNQDISGGNQCKAYGAAGIMRIPGRLRISWENDSTLRIDTDAGTQTRRFLFARTRTASPEPSLQGDSFAQWETADPRPDVGGRVSRGGQLKVVTSNMRPGYYFKPGVPYSSSAVMTEYFTRISEDSGDEYMMVTTVVQDPQYLTQDFIRTLVFKRERDGSKFKPTPCSSK